MDLRRCRLTEKQQDRLAEFFVAGVTARTAADLLGVNRKTAAYFYHRLRQIIAQEVDRASPLAGLIEVDESYFGGHRKGKRRRGAAGKVPVFGLLKRGGRVYTAMIPSAKSTVLMGIIREKVRPDSVIYTDSLNAYDVLDVSEFHHQRINHSEQFVEAGKVHINGIENFWNQAKRHLRRYNGIPKANFHLFLKECEWRFNDGSPAQLLKQLKSWVRKFST
jgi:transposase